MEEQFPREEGYNIAKYTCFKFEDDREPVIYAIVPKQNDRYVVGFQPSNARVRIRFLVYSIIIIMNIIIDKSF